jgi:hypothetical protein
MTQFFFVSTQLTDLFYERPFGRDLKVVVVAQHLTLHKLMMMMLLSLREVSSICEDERNVVPLEF